MSNVLYDATTKTNLSQVQNVGKAEYYGAEAGMGYQFVPQLRVDANYTHIIRNNLSSPQIYFTDVPRNKVFASAQYSPLTRLYFLASEGYNSKRYSTSYGTVAGSFYLTNVKAHINLYKGFAVGGGINNLSGRNYFANLVYNY